MVRVLISKDPTLSGTRASIYRQLLGAANVCKGAVIGALSSLT